MIRILIATLLACSMFAAEKAAEPIDAPPYDDLIIQAREAQRKGLMGKALDALEKAIKLDPKRVAVYFFKGQVLSTLRKPEEAIVSYAKVIELDPKASSA